MCQLTLIAASRDDVRHTNTSFLDSLHVSILLSIFRLWSLMTGKCRKIFRGHREAVTCLQLAGDYLISGAKDRMCKGMCV